MNSSLQPTKALSRLFSDWLRPESVFDRGLLDSGFNLLPMRLGVDVPSVNIKETLKEYSLEVAAPGLKRQDFKVEVVNHNLRISSEKEETKEDKKESNGYCRREYSYHSFSRSFALPENVNEDGIDAKYEDGILSVHIPKIKETSVKPAHHINVA